MPPLLRIQPFITRTGRKFSQLTAVLQQQNNSNKSDPSFGQMPGPPPLGDPKEQKRMLDLINEANKDKAPPPGMSAAEIEKFYESVNEGDDSNPLKPFPNNTNPSTGEVNGPRGPEPTRFGDWERNGRVSDF